MTQDEINETGESLDVDLQTNKEETFSITAEMARQLSEDERVIDFMRKHFSRLKRVSAVELIYRILMHQTNITVESIDASKSFIRYNLSKFDKNKVAESYIISLREELINHIKEISDEIKTGEEERIYDNVEVRRETNEYFLNKNTTYTAVRKLICDEAGHFKLRYNFNESDLEPDTPKTKITLQRSNIQILNRGFKFDYPLEFFYNCTICRTHIRKKLYEVLGTKGRIQCNGIETYQTLDGDMRTRRCKASITPDPDIGLSTDAYFYNVAYEDNKGKKLSSFAISFMQFEPGFYDVVHFRIKSSDMREMFLIIDIKPLKTNEFVVPAKKEDENYLFTLQKAFDKYIQQQTGMKIFGLYPIKVALIIQKIASMLEMSHIFNCQVVGDKSTGKTTVLKYYGYLMYIHFHLSSLGTNISVPGLRGTRTKMILMNKEINVVSPGYLGTYEAIHIDEIGENPELIQNLKGFLLEENYSYNKAGADEISHERTAHVNTSSNLDYLHMGQYRGGIRKAYRDSNIKIGTEEKPEWDETWDLHLPLYEYSNPYLRKFIKDKRNEYHAKKQFWIDGYELPLHDRFPFYFYLVTEKFCPELSAAIKENVEKNVVSENLKLIRTLISDDVGKVFEDMKKWKMAKGKTKAFEEVDKIMNQYGGFTDTRAQTFLYSLVDISRIANQRKEFKPMDFELIKWFIEKMNRKLDVADTVDYNIRGPPDLIKQEQIDINIEENTQEAVDLFGAVPEDFD